MATGEGLTGRWSLFDTAPALVEEKWEMAQDFAQSAYEEVTRLLNQLTSIARSLEGVDSTLVLDTFPPAPNPDSFNPSNVPLASELDIDTTFPSPPAELPFPGIDLSDLTEPSVDDLGPVPEADINIGDTTYSSSLLSAIQAKLLSDVENGGTGLAPAVETAIFQREQERALLAHNEALDRISSEWSKRGLPLPDGALITALSNEEVAYTNKRLDVSRDISIKQADLAQVNTKFALQQGTEVERMLIGFVSDVGRRLLDGSRALVEMKLAVYTAQLNKYRVLADIYVALVNSRIAQAKALVDIYIGQVQAYVSTVQAKSAQIDAVIRKFLGEVELYKSEAQVYETLTNVNLRVYEAEVNRILAKANLYIKNAEVNMRDYEVLAGLRLEAMKGAAQVAAQLIAGALSSVHASAGISASDSSNYSYSGPKTIQEIEDIVGDITGI